MKRGARFLPALLLAALFTAPLPAADQRVLFLGNSYTYHRDLPALVTAMARSLGHGLVCADHTAPDAALEDHWQARTRRKIAATPRWDVLVLQQGPSTTPENRRHLQHWVQRWADLAREHGVQPAVFMVWPYAGQAARGGFLSVSESHRAAAQHARARLFPVAEAWALALHEEPRLRLYENDGLNSTREGAWLAALVLTHGLTGAAIDAVPAELALRDGTRVAIAEEHAALFRRVVARLAAP